MKGTIVRWFDFRGFGFIEPEGEEDTVFAHVSEFKSRTDMLKVGLDVEFEVESSWKGPRAVNIKPLN